MSIQSQKSKGEIIDRLYDIFKSCGWEIDLDLSTIKDGVFEELGLSSVEALEYLFLVENEFDIVINDEDLNANLVKSFDVLANYIILKTS